MDDRHTGSRARGPRSRRGGGRKKARSYVRGKGDTSLDAVAHHLPRRHRGLAPSLERGEVARRPELGHGVDGS